MDDLAYLPAALFSKSLSTQEIVLTLPNTVEAVRLLAGQNIAVVGWEAWGLYPDGRKGHAGVHRSDYPGRHTWEIWTDFVQRAARECIETARHADAYLRADPNFADVEIHFCLSITTEHEE